MPVKEMKPKEATKRVDFQFFAPGAGRVTVAGTFNQWDKKSHPLRKDKQGNWTLTLALKPGRYEYRYLVDNLWENEQSPVELTPNAFGTFNCVLVVK